MQLSLTLATLVLAALLTGGPGDDATTDLERKLTTGSTSGATYLNLGNAYVQSGRWPEAILAFENARRLLPGNTQAAANLEAARAVVARERHPAVTYSESSTTPRWIAPLYVLGTVLYLAGSCMPIQRRSRALGWLRRVVVAAGATLLIHVALATWNSSRFEIAVVRQTSAELRTGNGMSYGVQANEGMPIILGLGQEVWLRHYRTNGWYQVELANGVVGWLPEEALVVALPLAESTP